MNLVRIAAILLFTVGALRASTVFWGGGTPVTTLDVPLTALPVTELPEVSYHGAMVPALPLPVSALPLAILNELGLTCSGAATVLVPGSDVATVLVPLSLIKEAPIQVQALAINLLLDRWIKLDSLLDTPALYKGNYFAVESAAIRKEAEKEGVSDAILVRCAAFAAALKHAEGH